MSLRDTMRKAASLIVELPPRETEPNLPSSDIDLDNRPANARLPHAVAASQTMAHLVQNAAGPDLDQIEITREPANAAGENALDFGAAEMLNVLHSIPANVTLPTKSVTVKAVLGAMANSGAAPENIVADVSRKLAALDAFHGFEERKTNETIETSQSAIADLEAQIEARRQAIYNAQGELARVTQGCESEADKLDKVLEFFSRDDDERINAEG